MGLIVSAAALPDDSQWGILWAIGIIIGAGCAIGVRVYQRRLGITQRWIFARANTKSWIWLPLLGALVAFALIALELLINWPDAFVPWQRVIAGLLMVIIGFPLLMLIRRRSSAATVTV